MTPQPPGSDRPTVKPAVDTVVNALPTPPAQPAIVETNPPSATPDVAVVASPAVPESVSPGNSRSRRAGNVRDILNDPVTAHMGPAAPLLLIQDTVEESRSRIRQASNIGRVVYFYVVDDEKRLRGVVSARDLLLNAPGTPIANVMRKEVIAVPSRATIVEACEFFVMHKLLAFPVIDDDRRVIGAVDVDLYTSEIQEIDRRQDSEDLFQLIGVHLTPADQTSAKLAFRGRFPWLLCNIAGGMLAAFLADWYQDVSTLVVVAPFIALVTALAESVSIQSVGLALQILHRERPQWRVFASKVGFEVLVGLMLGVACGLAVGALAFLWKGDIKLAFSLLLGIVGGVAASAAVGLSLPYILKLMRRDPQLAAGPIALAIADVITLLFYFNLGRWLLL